MNEVGFSSKKMDWRTPPEVFEFFNKQYRFDLDAASTSENALCENHLTDAFNEKWSGQTVWLNPPYGRDIGKWLAKAREEAGKGRTVACLIFARTDTLWWHEHCARATAIYFIKGRIKFLDSDGKAKNSATAPSCLVVFTRYPPSSPNFYHLEIPK